MLKKIYIGLIYVVSFICVKKYAADFSIHALLLFYLGILINTGILDFFGKFIESYKHDTRKIYSIKYEVFLYVIFAVSLICIQPLAWSNIPWLAENIDLPTLLFFLFLPTIWILKFTFTETAKISLVCLSIIPFLLVNQNNSIAETFAILTYLLWGAMIFQVLFQKN